MAATLHLCAAARRRWLARAAVVALLPVWPGLYRARAQGTRYPVTVEEMRTAQDDEMSVYYRYSGFGRQAKQEGYHGIAYLFVAFAAAEFIHAGNFGRILARLNVEVTPAPKPAIRAGNTRENLIAAADGEAESVDVFYPRMLEKIRAEGYADAIAAVRWAWATEERHRDAIRQIQRWSPSFFEQVARAIDKKTGQYYVCQICGCTLNVVPADACPVCGNPPSHYRHIDPPA